MSTHRIFAQLAFERALGNAAIDALQSAIEDKRHHETETEWPKNPAFGSMSGYDIEQAAAELDAVIEDRMRDVLDGPGLANIERGDRFWNPDLVAKVMEAKAKRHQPG